MTLLEVLLLVVVAGICGSLGQSIAGSSRGGCLVAIVIGFIGAMLGLWLARVLQLPEFLNLRIGEETFPLVWSVIGATLFVVMIRLLTDRRRPRDRE